MERGSKVVLDELKICYVTTLESLKPLMVVGTGETIEVGLYKLHRMVNSRFKYFFSMIDHEGEVGHIKFCPYTDAPFSATTYVYLKVQNKTLYDKERLLLILSIPEEMGMVFNNYTELHLAIDTTKNVPSLIKRLLRDKTITTIINGRVVKDRKKIQPGIFFEYSTSLDRLKHPTLTFKQRKAVSNKVSGITIQAYDKKSEIENHSDKQYILEYYGHPKSLYRLEVRIPYQEIKDYFAKEETLLPLELVNGQTALQEMFFYHLSSVLRFRKGRNVIQ